MLFILWKIMQEVVSPNRSVYHGFLYPFFLTSLRCGSGFIMHEIHERCRGVVVEEQLPFPEVAPVCFRLKQTSRPRKWFLKIVSGPYPFCTEWSKNVINSISNLFIYFYGFFSLVYHSICPRKILLVWKLHLLLMNFMNVFRP